MNQELNTVLSEMDILWKNFVNCRAYFPCVPENMVGQITVDTAPYYIKQGLKITFGFNEGLSKETIQKINEIGHWVNQNFVVRLCALLESHHVISNQIAIDQNIQGWEELDLVRRLRNYFAHSSGKYNPEKDEHRKTMKKLVSHLNLGAEDREDFPLAIDTVLEQLFLGCKKYVKGK
ncbi:MAG: hypothetical protein JRE47_11330 [Deltaproteobacteria bacterium]|nr:hypothetical protein [Deltaproteobacteria bacterium]